jgi:hypothetical protein
MRQKPFPADSRTVQNHCLQISADPPVLGVQVDPLEAKRNFKWLQTTDALSVKRPNEAECKFGFALRVKFA